MSNTSNKFIKPKSESCYSALCATNTLKNKSNINYISLKKLKTVQNCIVMYFINLLPSSFYENLWKCLSAFFSYLTSLWANLADVMIGRSNQFFVQQQHQYSSAMLTYGCRGRGGRGMWWGVVLGTGDTRPSPRLPWKRSPQRRA